MKANFELDPAQWSRLRGLLDEALALTPEARATWIESLGPEDVDLKPRLRALLAHAGGSPLDTLPRVETAQFAPAPGDTPLAPGATVGPYRLLRLLGEGGMGQVWLAERNDLLHKRQVALKLPRLVTGRAALAERLAREREILATLAHPHIARLYDAGISADGKPYLALEYVEGERIDAYCARKGLGVPARLRLFLQVARAVAHAHAQLIVHRDLKPANILVSEAGEAKLLDFGIAKLLEDGRAQETELTQVAGRALTPDYAAPEQILGQPIGTAADVYGLGVVLFEVLSGQRPYKLVRGSRAELEEAIVAAEPARPSGVVADPKLRKALRGDLDTIVGKALKKAPAERYATVEAFAEDIERYLERRPVRAQPDRRLYRLRKFVARNRVAVAAAATVLVAVLTGAAVALWQARVAIQEKQRAEQIKDFVAAIFRDASPWAGPQRKLTAAELLKLAHSRVGQRFGDRPATRIELLTTLGASLAGVGEAAEAEALLRAAIEDATGALGATHALTLAARAELVKAMTLSGRTRERRAEIEALLPLLERDPQRFTEQRVALLLNLADVLNDEGRYREVGETATRALELAQAELGPNHPAQLNALQLIVNSHTNLGALKLAREAAERLYRLAVRIYPEPSRHPGLLDARFVYGRTLAETGDQAAAIPLIERSIADARAVFGNEDIRIAIYARALTAPLLATGQLGRALESAQTALRVLSAHYPPDSVHLAYALVAEASVQAALRRPAAALASQSRAVAILGQAIGDGAEYTLHVRVQRAHSLAASGDSGAALRELHAIDATHRTRGHPNRTRLVNWMVETRRLAGDHRGALAELDAAYGSTRPEGFAAFRPTAEFGLNRLALGAAEAARADLESALALHRRHVEHDTPARADLWVGLGRAWLQLGQAANAKPLLEEADAFWRAFDPDNRWAGEAAFWLARCYEALGRSGDAKREYARAAKILARSPLAGAAARLRFAQRASR